MKTVTVRDLQKNVKACVDKVQDEGVVITRHGRPLAVLVGVEGVEQGQWPHWWPADAHRLRNGE
jgi:prevent-host-death family protein